MTTLKDAEAYVKKMAAKETKSFTLFCSNKLYNKLLAKKNNGMGSTIYRMSTLLSSCGIDSRYEYNNRLHYFSMNKTIYYKGFHIWNAVKNKKESKLSSTDKKALKAARKIVSNAKKSSVQSSYKTGTKQSKIVASIMEQINKKIKYTINDKSTRDDCIIGALLDGKANCDGYTDAFYLCANLAGIPVQYQHGTNKESDKWDSTTHIWNKVKISGNWYYIDCTWCDTDAKDKTWVQNDYTYFLMGKNYAKKYYLWFDDFGASVAAKSDFNLVTYPVYRANSMSKVKSSINTAMKKRYKDFMIYYTGSGKVFLSSIANSFTRKSYSYRYYVSGPDYGNAFMVRIKY